jgi:Xaa-Pro aminopeptidase
MAVDWETRVDYDRLRAYRLQRTKEQLTKNQIGAFLCFDFNNIRYITGVHVGEWARDKMQRYVVLPRGGEPTLFEVGTAAVARKRYAPWMVDHIRTGVGWQRGAVPQADLVADRLVATVKQILCEYGVEKEPVAIDIMDVTLLNALRKAGLENLVDAQWLPHSGGDGVRPGDLCANA